MYIWWNQSQSTCDRDGAKEFQIRPNSTYNSDSTYNRKVRVLLL